LVICCKYTQNAWYTQFQDGMKASASHLQTRCKGWGRHMCHIPF